MTRYSSTLSKHIKVKLIYGYTMSLDMYKICHLFTFLISVTKNDFDEVAGKVLWAKLCSSAGTRHVDHRTTKTHRYLTALPFDCNCL